MLFLSMTAISFDASKNHRQGQIPAVNLSQPHRPRISDSLSDISFEKRMKSLQDDDGWAWVWNAITNACERDSKTKVNQQQKTQPDTKIIRDECKERKYFDFRSISNKFEFNWPCEIDF